ncbi:MAG: SGNH/GDSL hydrolase family protein [Lachnospiraceae bacterium]|nr:SGNH/GDSL hydrolase family protein [Lachnospiraceae bacterium]
MKKKDVIQIVIIFVIAAILGLCIGKGLKIWQENKAQALKDQEAGAMVRSYDDDDDDDDSEDVETTEESSSETQTTEEKSGSVSEGNTENSSGTEVATESEEERVATDEEKYTYVAIGNSITCNEYPLSVEGLWWSSSAMCVSSPKKDYPHLFRKYLDKKTSLKKDVKLMTVVCKNWENAVDRNYYADIIIDSLPENTRVISLQLGENVTENKENISAEFEYLFSGIRNRFPEAKIMLFQQILFLDGHEDVDAAMYSAAENNGISIINIDAFNEKYESEYKAYEGMEVLGDDGNTYVVSDITVAAHPNDAGHACLAELLEATYESIAD